MYHETILNIMLGPKLQNQLCDLIHDNCDDGLKCTAEDDGCDSEVGRCKRGSK